MKRWQKSEGFADQYLFIVQEDALRALQKDALIASFYVSDIGLFPHAQYHFRQRHEGCAQNILLYCVAGSGHYRLDGGAQVPLSAGSAAVIPAGVPHAYAASEDAPWSIYWMHFGGGQAAELCTRLVARQPIFIGTANHEEIIRGFHRCFDLLKRPYHADEYYAVCQHAACLLAQINLAGKQAGLAITDKGSQAVDAALHFMKRNLHRNVTLHEIAASARFSASHLHCLFKASTGYAPMEYFIHMKMQAAGKELYFTDKPVKEIAAAYGLADSCYFSRVFKKTMGVSPLAYRNMVRG